MSYIGQGLPADTFQGFTTDSFTGDGSATTFTLSKEPFSEDTLIVVINNVIQQPGTNFTVSGTTLTIVGTAVANGDPIYAIHMGGPLPIGGASELDLNGASDKLILDADADTTISADTDDQIDFKLGGVDEMTMSSSGIVINEGSNDRDFRVEGNGNTHALFIRGSDDHVGINEDAPDCRFHIKETNDTSFSIDNFTNIDNSILKLENASTTNDAFVNMSFRTGDGMDLFFGGVQDSSDGNKGSFVFGRQDSTDVELLRINGNGNMSIGTSVELGRLHLRMPTTAGTDPVIHFSDANGDDCGSIDLNASANTVAYTTSSDYRLKENVNYSWDATTELKKLKPAKFNFKADADTIIEGFLAHEVSDIVPLAVTGEKDAVDKDGNIVAQAIDQSKLVPLMVKTIQELEARIKTLEDA